MVYLLLQMNSDEKLREMSSLLPARNPFENFVVLKSQLFRNPTIAKTREIRFYFIDILKTGSIAFQCRL